MATTTATPARRLARQARGQALGEPGRDVRRGARPRLRRARRPLRPRRAGAGRRRRGRSTPATTSATARSEGERVSIHDMEDLVADIDRVVDDRPQRAPRPAGRDDRALARRPRRDPLRASARRRARGARALGAGRRRQPRPARAASTCRRSPTSRSTREWLSRDPEVGAAYAEDELVWHGPFKRETLRAIVASIEPVAAGGDLGDLPTLWIHGERGLPRAARPGAPGGRADPRRGVRGAIYAGRPPRGASTRPTRTRSSRDVDRAS